MFCIYSIFVSCIEVSPIVFIWFSIISAKYYEVCFMLLDTLLSRDLGCLLLGIWKNTLWLLNILVSLFAMRLLKCERKSMKSRYCQNCGIWIHFYIDNLMTAEMIWYMYTSLNVDVNVDVAETLRVSVIIFFLYFQNVACNHSFPILYKLGFDELTIFGSLLLPNYVIFSIKLNVCHCQMIINTPIMTIYCKCYL